MRTCRRSIRDYEIYSDRLKIKGDNYVEISTGRYTGNFINEGSIFINEESFLLVEGIIKRQFKKYIHDDINNISRTKGRIISSYLREASASIVGCTGKDIYSFIACYNNKSPSAVNELIKSKLKISTMFNGLADYMDEAYENNDWICVSLVSGLAAN
jgi:hypothetical protein